MVGFSATRCATTMPTVPRQGYRIGRATRYTTTTRMVRRRGLPPEWATRPTIMVRMARRPVRPPERAGNSGLNVVPSGGVTTRSAARCGHRATPLRSRGSPRRTPLREHLSRDPSRLPTRGHIRRLVRNRAPADQAWQERRAQGAGRGGNGEINLSDFTNAIVL